MVCPIKIPISIEDAIPRGRPFARVFFSARTGPRDLLRCSLGAECRSQRTGLYESYGEGADLQSRFLRPTCALMKARARLTGCRNDLSRNIEWHIRSLERSRTVGAPLFSGQYEGRKDSAD